MPRLYFKYGTMGSSKSANALVTRFNYMDKGFNVLLLKPSIEDESNEIVATRLGIKAEAILFDKEDNFDELLKKENEKLMKEKNENFDVIIIDEAQFLTASQVEQLKNIADYQIPVMCFGLKTNYASYLFEGSKRLLELADSISEIKSICKCGRKAIMNGRIVEGNIVKTLINNNEIDIGSDDKYIGMCYKCWNSDVHYI